MNNKRLQKIYGMLEKGHKLLLKDEVVLNRELADLQNKKALVMESRLGCETNPGDRISTVSSWNLNNFVSLTSVIFEMIDERIQQQKMQRDALNKKIKDKSRAMASVDRLLIKEQKRLAELQAHIEQIALEDGIIRKNSTKDSL